MNLNYTKKEGLILFFAFTCFIISCKPQYDYSGGVFMRKIDPVTDRRPAGIYPDHLADNDSDNVSIYIFWTENRALHVLERINYAHMEEELERVYFELLGEDSLEAKIKSGKAVYWDYLSNNDTLKLSKNNDEKLKMIINGTRDRNSMLLKADIDPFATNFEYGRPELYAFYPMRRK